MPLSIFKRLSLGEANPTTITLQLADRSFKHPHNIIEDVLVKVDKFIFSPNFIILDMEEDKEIPIILGRQFLVSRIALIDALHRTRITIKFYRGIELQERDQLAKFSSNPS